MNKRCILILGLLLAVMASKLMSQTFSCDGSLLIASNQDAAPNEIHQVVFGPFGTLFFSQIKSFPMGQFDAIGFNAVDSYLYGVQHNSNEMVRIKADQSFETIGTVPFVDALDMSAGDCSPFGQYYGIENALDQLLVFDVVNNFALLDRIDLFWDPDSDYSGAFTARLGDLAIDPGNPAIGYAFQGDYNDGDLEPFATRGFLHRINLNLNDPDVGKVTPIGKISTTGDDIRKMGALFFDAGGSLYGYGSTSTGPTFEQNNFVYINKFTGDASVSIWPGPIRLSTDGCSCPYTLSFICDVDEREVLCTQSQITYSLIINNRFYQAINGAVVTDSLADGMLIEEISGFYSGDIVSGTGVGTDVLQIENLSIPARSEIRIDLLVQVNDIAIDFVENQAILSNLPERLGEMRLSDDPASAGAIPDPTTITGHPQTLNDFAIDISPPSDCINANDAVIQFSAPVLIPGIEYNINLRNEDWEFSSWEMVIDNNNSFTLENMTPGEYTLFSIAPLTSNCSFAMQDTTINVIPPNEQLSAEAYSNAPLCEFSALELTAAMSPMGSVEWSGPIFNSTEFSAGIPSITTNNSGTYEMVATYGACEQIRTLEVEVAPDIEAAIMGDKEYCLRESMQLTGAGEGDLIAYQWTAPDGTISSGPQLSVPSMAEAHAGSYELVVDNGVCTDSSQLTIALLPSPTISLLDTLLSDFCQTETLSPYILGDANVTYTWLPEAGLTCYDCPSPDLLIPIEPYYKLHVINEYACADTAYVYVQLDKEKLIYVPNAFSPNLDGQNDRLNLFPSCPILEIRQMEIYNRWGGKVFSQGPVDPNNNAHFWDGKIRGEAAAEGVYMYKLEILLKDGSTETQYGDLTIIR